ncbi:ubiquinone anaerobic biosynthesis accessory factor UbiT [Roseinatronobacter sp.]|uniref:ubiquinone anaerobic biosynthesis accessory factor UbiT n=1 Tax=Roseinatronobacter sp. TaxID=1945755 RepID=UPI003F7061B3
MCNDPSSVRTPVFITAPMHVLPLWPLTLALSQLARKLLRAHPQILTRIDKYQSYVFVLDITDLPFILQLDPAQAQLRAFRRNAARDADARIAGTLAAFLAMLHGVEDGDSLYFSGALQIEGDTSAVLALRNALDDAELDLSAEIARALPLLAPPLRMALTPLERVTGLHLRRAPQEVY